jgi:hypothetical protein
MDSSDQISRAMRVSRRRMLVLGGVAASTGLLAATRGAWADTPTPTPLEPALATLSIPTSAPGLATLTTPAAIATPAALATVAPRPTPEDVLAMAARLGIDVSKMTLPQQYPTWNDGHGWDQAQQYKTIQLADIDGDGQAELLGRGANGMQVYHWNRATHLWDAVSLDGPMSDKDGWDQPQHYLTIQLADIDGDGQVELLGRGANGMQVYHWNKATHAWDAVSLDGPMGDNGDKDGWDQPQSYSTIQLADVDGDGQAELIGRGTDGIQTYHWNKATSAWDALNQSDGLMSDANGWGHEKYYLTIQFADVDADGQAELIGRGANGIQTYHWDKTARVWNVIASGGPMSDKDGWDQAQYYSTIQMIDLNGDGRAELFGRGPAISQGTSFDVQLYMWEPTWVLACGGGNLMGDAWGQPQYYSTIQFADIDGDGQAELVGRGPDGLIAYSANCFFVMAGSAGIMTDVAGWDAPQSYLSIQAADVDGDGAFEIVGRGSDGIQTWKWGSGNTSGPDPQPAANMTALTMAGMMAATGAQSTSGPTPASLQPPLAAVTPVATATRVPPATQTPAATATKPPPATPTPAPTSTNPPLAEVTPAATATNPPLAALTPVATASLATPTPSDQTSPPIELVAPLPLLGFHATPTGGTGFYQPIEPGFPDYSQNPGQFLSYQLISQYLLQQLDSLDPTWPPPPLDPPNPLLQDIRGQYTNTLLDGKWSSYADALAKDVTTPPPGVSDTDFGTVRQQLHTELIYVAGVYRWFDKTRNFLELLFPAKRNAVDTVADALEDYSDDVDVILNWLALGAEALAAIVSGLAAFAESTLVGPIIAAAISLASSIFAMGAYGAGDGTGTIKAQASQLKEQLNAAFQSALQSTDLIEIAYLQHWALLQKLGEPIADLAVSWPVGLTDKMVAQGTRGYEVKVWKTLTPAGHWFVDGHWSKPDEQYAYHYTNDSLCSSGDWLFLQYGRVWPGSDPSSKNLDNLFGTPTIGPDGIPTGSLGASFEDAVLSRNGWQLKPYTESDCSLPSNEYWLEQTLLRHRRANPAPKA